MTAGGTAKLTTHVLDTALGRPAAGLAVTLFRLASLSREELARAVTNADGRCDAPLLEGAACRPGVYELLFRAGDYLRTRHPNLSEPPFLDEVPIRFGLGAGGHTHVPLLLSPFGYSTYRGS